MRGGIQSATKCILYVIIFYGYLPFAAAEAPSKLVLGVPPMAKSFNILDKSDQIALIARNIGTIALTRVSQEPNSAKFHLSLCSSLNVSADGATVFLRIKDDARFINANPVSFRDIEYSLARCQREGSLARLKSVSRPKDEARYSGNWVELGTEVGGSNQLLLALARCPILEESSSRLFGDELGVGTNLVSANGYHLLTFASGKRLVFERVRFSNEEKLGPQQVELLAYNDSQRALSSLRGGELDAFITDDLEVVEKADVDSTLRTEICGTKTLVARRRLNFSCDSNFSLLDTTYEENEH